MGVTVGLLYISGYELKNIYKAISVDNQQDLEQNKEPILVDAQVRFRNAVKLDNGNYSLKNSQFNEKENGKKKKCKRLYMKCLTKRLALKKNLDFF